MWPALIAAAAVAGSSYMESKRQLDYQEQVAKINADRANRNTMANLLASYTNTQYQYMEAAESASDQQEDNYLSSLIATDRAKVQAGAKGISGHSVDAMTSAIRERGLVSAYRMTQSLESQQRQLRENAMASRRDATNALQTAQVYKPTNLSLMIGSLSKGAQTGMAVYGATGGGGSGGSGGSSGSGGGS
ncbi:virion core protein, T7 gp14 family [Endozoicomonadaceae bacterium StTr2]